LTVNARFTGLYWFMRWLVGLALGFYFRRIDRFNADRVPHAGPVLFTSNHPGSLTDSFVIGASVPRKVNFVATVQLFRIPPLRWILSRCGVIPINRVRDNARAMRTVADTFEACFRVLERGEAIGIFPEGITYDDSRLKEVKTGAARMALEIEQRHGGKLGLQIVPVGLTYSAKERYRSDVLASFGEPIRAGDFLEGYEDRRKECIQRLTAEIEKRIQSLILHIPELEQTRVVEGVKRLYFDRLVIANRIPREAVSPAMEELLITRQISAAVDHVYRTQPERAAAFAARLDFYERRLARLQLSDEWLARAPGRRDLVARSIGSALLALLGAPVALYGWAHRLLPYMLIAWAKEKFAEPGRRKAQAATTAILVGITAFTFWYAVFVAIVHSLFGWPVSLWYALSLPPAGLLAHYYLRELRRLAEGVRNTLVLLRAPIAARRLLALRNQLISEIQQAHAEIAPETTNRAP